MYTRRLRFYFLAVLLLAAGCEVGERHQTTIQRRWPASQIRTVEVVGVDGNLVVEGGPPGEVSLVAHVTSIGVERHQRAENEGYFDTDLSGDTLHIGQKHGRVRIHFPFFVQRKLMIDYSLRVPPSVALDLKMINGRITTRGVDGASDLVTVNGPIDVETAGTSE